MNPFFQALKERKLVQWALAYLAGAWVALQVMDILGELFGWPLSLQRMIFALLIVGFFAVLVMAWFHGERGHQKVTGLEFLLLVGLVGAAGVFLSVLPSGNPDAVPAGTDTPTPSAPPASGPSDRPAVAVLPFRDLRSGTDQLYFADGIHEEIISQLARIRGLKVISRTSVMGYASTDRSIREIAAELGVQAVLEGGVRHAGDSVRITATLIDASRDQTLWSESYDRALTEIFAIQEDVARQVVRALDAALTSEESRRLESRPTSSLSAYDFYLLSRHHFRRLGPEGLARSAEMAGRAIAEDSAFARGWLALGRSSMIMALGHAEVGDSPVDEMEVARSALQRALDLDPALAEARAALSLVLAIWDYDLEAALQESLRAVQDVPGDAIAAEIRGLILSTAGRDAEALAAARRAVDLDPLAPVIASNLGWVYLNARRFDEALAQARRTLEIEPDFHDALTLLGRASIRTRRYQDAIDAYRRGAEVSDDNPEDLAGLVHALARAGQREAAREILGGLLERARNEFVPPLHVGYAYLGLGEDSEALTWFERGVEVRGGWNVWLPRYPEAEHLHEDPRFRALVARMGLTHLLEGSRGSGPETAPASSGSG